MTGFKPLSKHFSRQKSSAHFGEKREKGVSIRKPTSGLTVSKASGRQYCMQSIPLAVLKRILACHLLIQGLNCMQSIPLAVLKPTLGALVEELDGDCMQSIPLAVLKPCRPICSRSYFKLHAIHTACGIETAERTVQTRSRSIACNPYRLRY